MASYNEQMQELANQYQAATGSVIFKLKDVGAWAIENGLWQPSSDAVLRQFADDLSRALREEYATDPQGRRVRTKHAIRQDGEQGFPLGGYSDGSKGPHGHCLSAAPGSDRF